MSGDPLSWKYWKRQKGKRKSSVMQKSTESMTQSRKFESPRHYAAKWNVLIYTIDGWMACILNLLVRGRITKVQKQFRFFKNVPDRNQGHWYTGSIWLSGLATQKIFQKIFRFIYRTSEKLYKIYTFWIPLFCDNTL